MKVYGWDAVKLSDAYTLAELGELREQVEAQHRLPEPDGIYLFDKRGRRKLDSLAWAVRYRMQESAEAKVRDPQIANGRAA
jgi:hypothetical protein